MYHSTAGSFWIKELSPMAWSFCLKFSSLLLITSPHRRAFITFSWSSKYDWWISVRNCVFSSFCTNVWMEELVCFPVLKISSARETILNHRWELFSPHNERKWLEEEIWVQGGRFHRSLRSLLVNLCLTKQAQSWKKDYADGKQIRSGEVGARLCLECWPARSSGWFSGNVEEKSRNNSSMPLQSPVWLCWPSKTESVNPAQLFVCCSDNCIALQPSMSYMCLQEGSGVNKETGLSEEQTSSFTEQAWVLFGLLVLF